MALTARRVQTEIGELLVAAGPSGICRISFPVGMTGHWFPWFDRYFSAVPKTGDHPLIRTFETQLEEYLSSRRKTFELAIDLRGTDFQLTVWKRLVAIPYGTTITYGEVARELGIPGGSRAIGNASGRNPLPIVVPCHRVIGSTGQLVGFGGGIGLKEKLLELEGARIRFSSLPGLSS